MISYFDNCATTKVDDEVVTTLIRYATENFFNPSARSTYSLAVANDIATARVEVAKCLGANANGVYFTSGGTESDNLGIVGALKSKKGNVVATASEHSAVYNVLIDLQSKGLDVRFARVRDDGHIDVEDFLSKVDEQTLLACFMHVNNETGAINDVKFINAAVKNIAPHAVTFCDGIQAVGKIPVNISNLGVDLYTLSGHKFHAPKGVGALIVSNSTRVNPIVLGGGQEKGLRSGTENVGGIVAMGQALKTATENVPQNTVNFENYKQIIRDALSLVPNWRENCTNNCSPAIMSLAFRGIKGEVLLHMLERYEIIVGTGSACSSKNKQSRIAKAIGLPTDYSEGIIRISFSKYNTSDQVYLLAEKLSECVLALRKTMHVN